ncbi:MAG: ribonuclease P protein component [Clostridia bacterium]
MKNTVSIKENKDFKKLYYRGKSVANEYLVVYYRKNKCPYCRLGLTVSGKVGKAVVRNRIRRLIKESYRLMEDRISPGTDIVVVARGKAAGADFKTVRGSLERAFVKCGIIK